MNRCHICGLSYPLPRSGSRFFIYDALIPWCLTPSRRQAWQQESWIRW